LNITDINKLDHPWLSKQTDQGVQTAAIDLYNEYHGKKGIAFRDACAAFVEQVETGKLDYVDADGKPLTGTDAENRKTIITKILGEMDVPASTLRLWGFQRKVRLTYPKPIRDAAESAPLNLAKDHVRKAYDEMLAAGGLLYGKTPAQLDQLSPLEAGGIVLKLKKAKPPKPPTEPTSESTGIERFEELLAEALTYAKDEGITREAELISLFGRVFRLTEKLNIDALAIKKCMVQARDTSLTPKGVLVWQNVLLSLSMDQGVPAPPAMMAAAASAGASAAGTAPAGTGSVIDVDAISADAEASKKK